MTQKTRLIFLALIFVFSCDNNPLDVDVSEIETELEIQRVETAVFGIDPDSIDRGVIKNWADEFHPFFHRYINDVVKLGNMEDPALAYYMRNFTSDKDMREVYTKTMEVFESVGFLEKEFNQTFKYYKHHFPGKTIPALYSFVAGFNYAVVSDDSVLAIGLDMYLGKDCEFYRYLGIPDYRKKSMSKEYIISDAMRGWIQSEYPPSDSSSENMLSKMVYKGKLLYAVEAMMPDKPDSLIIRYTEDEMDWCRENEESIWFHFVDKELLYNQESRKIIKYIKEAPFTPGFPDGSPGRIGEWLGWQIVRRYMNENPEIKLPDLFKVHDAQKILRESNYKPKR